MRMSQNKYILEKNLFKKKKYYYKLYVSEKRK